MGWLLFYLLAVIIIFTVWHRYKLIDLRKDMWNNEESASAYRRYCKIFQCDEGLSVVLPLAVCGPAIVILYLSLMYEAVGSYTLMFMETRISVEDVMISIHKGRKSKPKLQLEVQCYHVEHHQGKIVTMEKYLDIPVEQCVDASGDIDSSLFESPRSFTRV